MTGVQKFAYAVCREMSALNTDLVFLCPRSISYIPPFGSVRKIGNLKGHLWEQLELPLYLKRKKIKTLLNLCNTAPLFSGGQVVCIHDLSFSVSKEWFSNSYTYAYRFLTPKIVKKAKQVLTVSEFSKNQISKAYSIDPEKIRLVYNGIFFRDALSDKTAPLNNEKYVLFVGSPSPRKNLKMLIEALEEIGEKDLNLIVVGKKNKIFKNGIIPESSRVRYYDHTNDAELQNLYKYAKMLVMPSFYEGFGLPVLEALFFNCPVICSDIPVFRELFGENVTFFNLNSKEDLKEKIRSILNDEEKIKINVNELLRKFNYGDGAKLILDIIDN